MTQVELSFRHCRRDSEYYRYQRYYVHGLRSLGSVRFGITPARCSMFASAREAGIPKISRLFDSLSLRLRDSRGITSDYAGRYFVTHDGRSLKAVIDSHDSREIADEDAYQWADVYFKSNCWPGITYPPKVRPIVNGNGFLDKKRIARLINFRNSPKSTDLAFISRVWAGKGDLFWSGLDHQVRLFEALAGMKCSKNLLAIFPKEYRALDIGGYLSRLERSGVKCIFGFFPAPELWSRLGAAKVVFMRSGKHLCMPWRMIDLLCMGACVAFDSMPWPEWPEPLRPNGNFADCGLPRTTEERARPDEAYASIPDTVHGLLNAPRLMQDIRENNIRYFEGHAAPQQVAKYFLRELGLPVRPGHAA